MRFGKSESKPALTCPQCRAPAPAAAAACPACGAELYARCPECGTDRGPDDGFCRQCGFNFSRKKLRLKDAPAGPGPSAPLPQIGAYRPGKRYQYRMSPFKGGLGALLMLAFLLVIAAGLFFGLNPDWGRAAGQWLRGQLGQAAPATPQPGGARDESKPDWKARYRYWQGYYRDVFALPPTQAVVRLEGPGLSEQGLFVKVEDGQVFVLKDGNEIGIPRLALDDATRLVFFQDDFVAAGAKARVLAEQEEWRRGSAPSERPAAAPTGSPAPSPRASLDIQCPACAGMGYRVVAGPRGKDASAAGSSLKGGFQSASPAKLAGKQTCPVCGGKGLRHWERPLDFPWPAGASRCGACGGMGSVPVRSESGPWQANRCSVCDGRGYEINQYDAARNVPPKYE